MATITRRESIYDKAKRILADPARVRTSPMSNAPDWWTGEVDGDRGITYRVAAVGPEFAEGVGLGSSRLACTCPAGEGTYRRGRKPQLCKHMLVGEEMRLRGESE